MNTVKLTQILVVVLVVALSGIDVWLYVNETKGDTISEVIRAFALQAAPVPLWAGILCGHWFWPGPDRMKREIDRWTILLSATVLSWVVTTGAYYEMPILLLLGVILGHVVWGMPKPSPRDEQETEQ